MYTLLSADENEGGILGTTKTAEIDIWSDKGVYENCYF